jgi:hypothetical protein
LCCPNGAIKGVVGGIAETQQQQTVQGRLVERLAAGHRAGGLPQDDLTIAGRTRESG